MKKIKNLQLIFVAMLCISLSTLLVACGAKEPVKISFETNGGSPIAQIEIDENFQMPQNPTKQGFTFDGWYIDRICTARSIRRPFSVRCCDCATVRFLSA